MAKIELKSLAVKSTELISLENADRPYTSEEKEHAKKAKHFPEFAFKTIPPIPGTLAFLFRNLRGGNQQVIEFLRIACPTDPLVVNIGNKKWLRPLIDYLDKLDDESLARPDIFDWVCRKQNIAIDRFFRAYRDGAVDYEQVETDIMLANLKPKLLERIDRFSKNKFNTKDRELLAKATKLIDSGTAQTVINNNPQTAIVNNEPPKSFAARIRGESLNESQEVKPLELIEGKPDYIEGEIIETSRERVHVER